MNFIINKISTYFFLRRNSLFLTFFTGMLVSFAFAPFNKSTNFIFALFPLSAFVVLIPLFLFSINKSAKKSLLQVYLFGVGASISQYYWISNVVADGMQYLIIIGFVLAVLYLAVYYLIIGFLFRLERKFFPKLYVILFPATWILVEYLRGHGEIGFPWNFMGYTTISILPLAQFASIGGVYGLSFIVVIFNVVIWELLIAHYFNKLVKQKFINFTIASIIVMMLMIWGSFRLKNKGIDNDESIKISLIQPNIDQAHWGYGSLDTSLTIIENLVLSTNNDSTDLIILPESALFCYLVRRQKILKRAISWYDSVKIPIITGALHWDLNSTGNERYSVYNCAFMLDSTSSKLNPVNITRYEKIKLLPFSETMPFKAQIPIINRLNLGSSDFSAGTQEKCFVVDSSVNAGIFVCYEIVFPEFVRKRVNSGANILVNITNDGWFGKSTGAYHHSAMSRMRCIENGISMARCANSGVSMLVDQFGRVVKKTKLYDRTTINGKISTKVVPTVYTKVGDWPLIMALILLAGSFVWLPIRKVFIK